MRAFLVRPLLLAMAGTAIALPAPPPHSCPHAPGGDCNACITRACLIICAAGCRTNSGTELMTVFGREARVPAFTKMDHEWLARLVSPGNRAIEAADRLSRRADALVATVGDVEPLGPVDVVCSGGGNIDAYYMGVAMVLTRLEARGLLTQKRTAGVSAGGMLPFEIELKGEATTLTDHLTYGVLQEEHPDGDIVTASLRQDHQWRLMADQMVPAHADALDALSGRVFLGTTCLTPLPRLLLVDNYTSAAQAASAFMSTGTIVEAYEGKVCTDGGATSGARMTPLFHDGVRPQIIVSLLPSDHPGVPSSMLWRYNLSSFAALIERGQDDASAMVRCGAMRPGCWTRQIAVCPTDRARDSNVCADAPIDHPRSYE